MCLFDESWSLTFRFGSLFTLHQVEHGSLLDLDLLSTLTSLGLIQQAVLPSIFRFEVLITHVYLKSIVIHAHMYRKKGPDNEGIKKDT